MSAADAPIGPRRDHLDHAPSVQRLRRAEVVGHGAAAELPELLQGLRGHARRALEHGPDDDLVAAGSGEGAAVAVEGGRARRQQVRQDELKGEHGAGAGLADVGKN